MIVKSVGEHMPYYFSWRIFSYVFCSRQDHKSPAKFCTFDFYSNSLICLKRASDESSELERIFRESQMFLKYFRSFSSWIFEIARDQSPNDLHVAAEGSWKPIFLKRANKSWRESRSCTWRKWRTAYQHAWESWANDLLSKAQIFTSLDEVLFGC